MLNFTIRRIILVMLVALTVSVIAFFLVRLSGDLATALAGEDANAQEIADIKKIYGLDRPLIVQYADWLLNALRGDFGASLYFPETVGELVAMRLPIICLKQPDGNINLNLEQYVLLHTCMEDVIRNTL